VNDCRIPQKLLAAPLSLSLEAFLSSSEEKLFGDLSLLNQEQTGVTVPSKTDWNRIKKTLSSE
jgi:hypothetical protein